MPGGYPGQPWPREQWPPAQARLRLDHPLTRGLVLCYPFVERAGTPRNLAPIGGVAALSGTTKPTWLMGAVGPSLHGDGSSGYGDLGTGLSNTMTITRPLTVLALVRPSTVAAGRGAVSHSGLATTGGHKFGRSGAALLLTIHVQTTGATNVTTTATPLTTSAWWWIGAVVTTGNIHFVWAQAAPGGTGVLSTEDVANSTAGTAASNSFAHFLVDRSAGSALQEFFGGELAYYAWWAGRALSNAEINTLIRAPYDLLTLPAVYRVTLLAGAGAVSGSANAPAGVITYDAVAPTAVGQQQGSVSAPAGSITYDAVAPAVLGQQQGAVAAPAGVITYDAAAPTATGQQQGVIAAPAGVLLYDATAPVAVGQQQGVIAAPAGVLLYDATPPAVSTGTVGSVSAPAGVVSYDAVAPTVVGQQQGAVSAPAGVLAYAATAPGVIGQQQGAVAAVAGVLVYAATAPTVTAFTAAGRDITVTAGPLGTRWTAGALGGHWTPGDMST